jgi:hypothetical protein
MNKTTGLILQWIDTKATEEELRALKKAIDDKLPQEVKGQWQVVDNIHPNTVNTHSLVDALNAKSVSNLRQQLVLAQELAINKGNLRDAGKKALQDWSRKAMDMQKQGEFLHQYIEQKMSQGLNNGTILPNDTL